MNKKTKKNLLNKLNGISGWILIILGSVFFLVSLPTFNSEISLFYPVINTLSSIALIFLGIYVFRFEEWAIVLAGVYGLVSFVVNSWTWGLFSGGFRGIAIEIAYLILILNWWVLNKNDK